MAGGDGSVAITSTLDSNRDKLIGLDDLLVDAQEYVTSKLQRANPGVVIADFNGDGMNDVAMLTKGPKNKGVTLQLNLCTNSECHPERSENLGVFYGIHFISPVRPGSVVRSLASSRCPSGNCSIKIPNFGVKMSYFGKASITYYWDKRSNTFIDIPTSD
jgi:hypothetical protein